MAFSILKHLRNWEITVLLLKIEGKVIKFCLSCLGRKVSENVGDQKYQPVLGNGGHVVFLPNIHNTRSLYKTLHYMATCVRSNICFTEWAPNVAFSWKAKPREKILTFGDHFLAASSSRRLFLFARVQYSKMKRKERKM